jgi:hypothetical protein
MRTTQDYELQGSYASAADGAAPAGFGWVTFATVMLGFAGIWNLTAGILAVAQSRVYTAQATFVFSDLRTWGWIVLGLGMLQLIAAGSLFTGSAVARWFGITVAALNAIGQLLYVSAYPWWAISMFTVDVLIIYGLAVYGGARLRNA